MRRSVYNCKEQVAFAENLFLAGTPMVVFDLETTGINSETDRILSFSAIKVVNENGLPVVTESIDQFINPGFPIPEAASAVNHITDELVKDCPYEFQVIKTIEEFLGEKPFLCGYNSKRFDVKFMQGMYNRSGKIFDPLFHIDVYEMAKEKMDVNSYKLENVAHFLGADAGLSFHRSFDDVIATYRCYRLLKEDYSVSENEIFTFRPHIVAVNYWNGPSHKLERIYIKTNPYSKTFYDIYNKEWKSEDDAIDLDYIRNEVLATSCCSDEKELVHTMRKSR